MPAALIDLQYLPSISWFCTYLSYPEVWIEREENFVKSTARNRCSIAGAGGEIRLTIPLKGGRDHHRKYSETAISYQTNWHLQHWQSIVSAYGSAPFFEHYCEKFQKIYETPPALLFDFNLALLNMALTLLKLNKDYKLTAVYEKEPAGITDFRSSRHNTLNIQHGRYYQVFEERNGFISNLSILDLLFNLGPEAKSYLAHNIP
jgi:hypothetical protein